LKYIFLWPDQTKDIWYVRDGYAVIGMYLKGMQWLVCTWKVCSDWYTFWQFLMVWNDEMISYMNISSFINLNFEFVFIQTLFIHSSTLDMNIFINLSYENDSIHSSTLDIQIFINLSYEHVFIHSCILDMNIFINLSYEHVSIHSFTLDMNIFINIRYEHVSIHSFTLYMNISSALAMSMSPYIHLS